MPSLRSVQSIFFIVPRNGYAPAKPQLPVTIAALHHNEKPYARNPMKDLLNQLVAHRAGALLLLAVAAFLEAYGDSCFQSALYRASGMSRALAFVGGAISLAAYGFVVNAPRWEFGKLLGVYVVLFFLLAQVVARVKFGQSPTPPILIGGALICAGGLVISISG
jgi:drug/metabolite transporter superfamily protein YnfA